MFAELKPYPDARSSLTPWFSTTPASWSVAPGGGVLRPVKERNTALAEETVLSLSYGRVVVKPKDKLRGLVPESFESYQVLLPGDVVIRPTDLQNDQTSIRVGQVKDRGIITSAYIGFRCADPNLADYVYRYLSVLDLLKIYYGMGSGLRQNLEIKDFKRLPILLPPADEQVAIVKYLAHAQARIDRAILAKRKMIALLGEQQQVVINQAVTRGLDPTVPMKDSGIPWLGQIPAHWSVEPFLRCIVERADYRGATPEKVDHGVFLVTAKNVRKGWIDYDASREFVREGDFDQIMRRGLARSGDLLLTMEAPLGNVAEVDREGIALAQRLVRFRPNRSKLQPTFAVQAMNSAYFQDQFAVRATGSTAQGMKASKLPELLIALPPIQEQEYISAAVGRASVSALTARGRLGREIDLIREFRTRLTADVVTGQVDVRGIAATLPDLDPVELLDSAADIEDDGLDATSADGTGDYE